jgi:geranylgeranyl reductase family protein
MNLAIDALPSRCDVLVVGAGPAGSAAATMLARAGHDVVLIDQHAFPRDKVCGDGLIPDAHQALRRLGVLGEVMAAARASSHVGCIGPRGGRIEVPGALAVLPRRELDAIVARGAVAAGARLFAPLRFVAPVEEGGRVVGARVAAPGQAGSTRELRATWTVLATGAVPQALIAAGMALRQTPSCVALRGYVRNEAVAALPTMLEVVWHPRMKGGYGWIFPAPDGVFNVGVGLVDSHPTTEGATSGRRAANLRELFDAFVAVYAPLRRLIDDGRWVAPLKGAPLRCTLEGARLARPGLLVTGEAAGSTYSFTGEGIGKALETGMLAADAIGPDASRSDEEVGLRYEDALAALKPRFELYERANRVSRHPWMADFLIWRAQHSPRLLARMAGVLNETSNPGHLVTARGVMRLLFE